MMDDAPKDNRLIVMGDMNARVKNQNPIDAKEAAVLGKHALIGSTRTEHLNIDQDAAVINNRNRLIKFCLDNDLKI